MKEFSVSTFISAPPDRVWPIMSDVERWHEWTASITSVRILGSEGFGVGSRAVVRQPKLPPAVWKVTTLEPGHRFVWDSIAPGLKVSGHHIVEPAGSGSEVTLAIRIEGLLAPFWARLTKGITLRYIGMEAAGLRARAERR